MKEKNQREMQDPEILEASGLGEQTEGSGYFELERTNRDDKPQIVVDDSEDKGLIESEFEQVNRFSLIYRSTSVDAQFIKFLYISQNFLKNYS